MLDVRPENDTNPEGTTHTLTAVLLDPSSPTTDGGTAFCSEPRTQATNVDFEVVSVSGTPTYSGGTGSIDAASTPNTPDMTCTIPTNAGGGTGFAANSCTVSYSRAGDGQDDIIGFVDENAINTDNDTADFQNEAQNTNDPDSVDTVTKFWTGAANQQIDCFPENDINPAGTQHTVTCTVRSSAGALPTLEGADVDYQVTGANPTGPQHGCTTGANGQCSFTYTGNTPGNDTITAFVNQDGNHTNNDCAAPPAAGDPNFAGMCEVVLKTWQANAASLVNAEPETDTNPNGTIHTVDATVRNQFGGAVGAGQTVNLLVTSGPNQGATDTCATNAQGQCQLDYTDAAGFDQNNATDTICVYVTDQSECNTEPSNETEAANDPNAQPIGGSPGNDRADVVLKTWTAPAQTPATQVNAEPEDDTNPVGTQHIIGVFAGNASNQVTTATPIRADILPNSPNANTGTQQAEITCATDPNPLTNRGTYLAGQTESHECAYTSGAIPNSTGGAGTDNIRVFADSNNNGIFDQGEPFDDVRKVWSGQAFAVALSDGDTATAGTCNEFTVTVTDQQGNPVVGQIVDVEQVLQSAGTEPGETRELDFCNPTNPQGANPTGQGGTAFGDVQGNNQGSVAGQPGRNTTRHAEVGPTNTNGVVTFGIFINQTASNATVSVRAWVDTAAGNAPCNLTNNTGCDNDTFDAGEPSDAPSTKTWTPGGASSVTGLNAEPESATNPQGTQHQVTVTVTGAGGPIEGVRPNSIIATNASGRPAGDVADPNAGTSPNATVGNFEAYTCTLSNAQGISTCTYLDNPAGPTGTDTIVFYVNQASGGTAGPDAGEPQDAVQKTWTPGPSGLDLDLRCAGTGTGDDQDVSEQTIGEDVNAANANANGTPDCTNPTSDPDEVFTAIVTNPAQQNVGVQNIRVDFRFAANRVNGNSAGANNSTNDATLNATPGGQVGTSPANLQTFCITDATGRCSVTLNNATPQAGDIITVTGQISGATGGQPTDSATKAWEAGRVNQGGTITLTPRAATNQIGTPHTVTATVRNQFGQAVQGANVDFSITSGPNAGLAQAGMTDAVTDANGVATFTYTSNAIGTDVIVACTETGGTENDQCGGGEPTATANKTWQTGPVTTSGIALDMDADDGGAVNSSPPVIAPANPAAQCELTTAGADANRESSATNQIRTEPNQSLNANNFHRICAAAFQANQAGNNGRLAGAQITFTIAGPGRIFAATANGTCTTTSQPAAGTTVTVTANNEGYAFACLYSQQVGRTTVTASSGTPAQTATGTKDWTVSPSTARFIQLCHGDVAGTTCETAPQTNRPGDEHQLTARVTDSQGNPVANVPVQFRETGPAIFTPQGGSSATVNTDANGLASVLMTSDVEGDSSVVAEIDPAGQAALGGAARTPGATGDECEAPAGTNNTPPAGNCTSAALSKLWREAEPVDPECDDGEDNDGDGFIDFPDDEGCINEDDDEEPVNQGPVEKSRHGRRISIRFNDGTGARNNGLVVFGRVRLANGGTFVGCIQQVPVNIQRRINGRWVTKKTTNTNRRGRYAVEIFDQASNYRAVAPRVKFEDVQANTADICLKAVKAKRHRHRR